MTEAPAQVVLRQVVVKAPLERAFELFTTRFGDIKPRDHYLMSSPLAETVFERHVGGRIYDRAEDGSVFAWARVLAYEPPNRVVFSWDIGVEWTLETDLENTSEVEIRFISEAPDRTRVELEHRKLDRHGPGWESLRDAIGNDQGWPLYLERFVTVVESDEVTRTESDKVTVAESDGTANG
ncbi:SRPBCC family protein [Actinoplanes sp. LDG1-06]|uniref:SRPBCC family protein n=1 Tax=Paractinoplanes ovalisporus TaxID=2810368 RepID=A0ABS2ARY0_9ACTN|nr:SRPBCC family protein [Actinoplanes ovalisporus]MBM2622612.1 SRPBCC family protein [Actinoplanes ovalisporus]